MTQRSEFNQMQKELLLISNYCSGRIALHSLRLLLIGYIFYSMLHPVNHLPSFYILATTILLPFISESIIENIQSTKKGSTKRQAKTNHFPLLKKKYHFKQSSHLSNSFTFLFCSILLVLWQIVQARTAYVYPLLSFYPLVVLSLIYLIRIITIPYIYIRFRIQLSSGNL